MKERPILFSTPMVQALLEDRKTQTRRIVKPQPVCSTHEFWEKHPDFVPSFNDDGSLYCGVCGGGNKLTKKDVTGIRNPYGVVGDRLWVRETYVFDSFHEAMGVDDWYAVVRYIAGGENRYIYQCDAPSDVGFWPGAKIRKIEGKVRPSIFMYRWTSRILLEITDVRVERLQDISEEDAIAEGVESIEFERDEHDMKICPRCGGTRLYTSFSGNGGAMFDTDCTKCDTHVKRYKWLWESINGEGNWNSNPFVWCVSFQKVTGE